MKRSSTLTLMTLSLTCLITLSGVGCTRATISRPDASSETAPKAQATSTRTAAPESRSDSEDQEVPAAGETETEMPGAVDAPITSSEAFGQSCADLRGVLVLGDLGDLCLSGEVSTTLISAESKSAAIIDQVSGESVTAFKALSLGGKVDVCNASRDTIVWSNNHSMKDAVQAGNFIKPANCITLPVRDFGITQIWVKKDYSVAQ